MQKPFKILKGRKYHSNLIGTGVTYLGCLSTETNKSFLVVLESIWEEMYEDIGAVVHEDKTLPIWKYGFTLIEH